MAILKVTQDVTGQVGVVPQEIYIETNDTLAEVTAVGYLNAARTQGYQFSNKQIAHVYGIDFNDGLPGCLNFMVQTPANPSTGNYTLISMASAGEVVLPVTANHIATFVGTTGEIGDDAATAINGGNIQAGLSGTAGYLASFPGAASKGSLRVTGVANTGDTVTTISNAAMGQASVVSIPDPGAADANFIISKSAGTQQIASGSLQIAAGNLSVGSNGVNRIITMFAPTASKGTLVFDVIDNADNYAVTVQNASFGQSSAISIPDPGASTANFVLDTGAANILAEQQFVSLTSMLLATGGTWTMTRIAQANYGLVHTPADDTSVLSFDITPILRAAANKGFRLNSIDVIYHIGVTDLDAHTIVLDSIAYVNNVANAVTSVPLTGSLAVAVQANPYVTNIAVTTPAFLVTADAKYVVELTVNAAVASTYTLYGMNLRFSQTIA